MTTFIGRKLFVLSALGVLGLSTSGEAVVTFDFNANNGGFASTLNTAAFDGPWAYSATSGAGGSGGWSTEGQVPENQHPNTTDLTSGTIAVTSILGVAASGAVSLSFAHRWSFEDLVDHWDGGAVFVSANNGPFTQVPLASFSLNGYNGTLRADTASELKGLAGFVKQSADHAGGTFLTSTANIGTFGPADTLRIRFRAAYDSNTSGGSPDWVVDNISLGPVPEPSAALLGGLGLLGLLRRRKG